MRHSQVHVIGAGLAGLSAAMRLADAGVRVVVHEAARQAGGRCRSYHDDALGMTIDNGNHLVLSGNRATLEYLKRLGAVDRLSGPDNADYPFMDLASHERWRLRLSHGRLPWWIFAANRRVPGTRPLDYLAVVNLLRASPDKAVAEVMKCDGPLYERLWQPVLNAALNTDPKEASARLAATIIWETLAAGGRASRPLIAAQGLSNVFVDPAIECLQSSGTSIRFSHRLRAIGLKSERAVTLDFGDESAPLPADSAVVLAVPPWVAASLVPGLTAPSEFRAIVNAHFRVKAPADFPAMIGVVNGTVEWIFAFPDRLSVTISAGDRLLDAPREALARDLWREVAAVANIADDLPPWQIIKERRATFAALPSQEVRRPDAKTAWDNLVLAGDWTATGLPGTIEGAIRSGNRAADLILQA